MLGLSILTGVVMARLVPVDRYRMVDLKSGTVVVTFKLYPGMQPMESCRRACEEFGIEPTIGSYRLDRLKQNRQTRGLQWARVYRFSLEPD